MTDFQKEALAALKLAANINPFGSVENAEARDAARRVLAAMDREPAAWINWSALTGKPRLGWECESELASEPLYRDPPARYSDIVSKGGMDPRDHKPWCASLSTLTAKPRPCDCVRVPLPTTPGSAARSADSADSFCKPSADLEKAARMALEALEVATTPLAKDRQEVLRAQAALRQALRNSVEQPAQQQKEGFASPGGGYVPAIPRPMPLDWKLVPRKATPEMLKAMDECAQEGYDERLYAGMASSVYMAAWDASPVMGTLPEQPAQQEPVAFYVYKPTSPRGDFGAVANGDLPWVYDQDPSSGFSARMLVTPVTSPHRKPWVGLTDQEIENLWNKHESRFDYYLFSCAIEAKLKEKNA